MGQDPGLRRLALGTLLAAYPGPVPPDWAVDLLADGLAGHTLFGTNIHDPAQVAASTAALRAGRPDVIVAIDEEGGDVTRLAHATGSPYPGNAALGTVDDPALTREVYAAIGAELAALGVTLDLAPTVDVNTADENPVIGTRSFGADPKRVAVHSAAAVAGLQSTGVAACAKHFPGHGATVADSHHELPTVDVPTAVLRERDLPPFAAVVDAGVRAVMTAHIRVPALTGDGPATFSRAVLHDLLRVEYGFTGAVVTDALEMKGAVLAAGGVGTGAVRALAAGADLLNDTWSGADPALARVAAATGAGLVCSHAGGLAPRTRPHRAAFGDVVADVLATVTGLAERAAGLGVRRDGILIDPAHDFGKNTRHSLEITRRLAELSDTGWPLLVALSNKDFIGETLDLPVPERLEGTLAATAVSAWLGARVFRAHQVRETRRVLDMVASIRGDRPPAATRRGLA
ncbi:dihydropteroate synthase [Micromonospora chalcea]|uniref:glycoside hydrolase family 3 N-terminal domain-containing protein n=1 Tax=Micromonospora chalcea TaxID=1874 RepID=UPI0016570B63|nr:glycoside hydrolase family 3 N-terminal domain-containing protein [Micromonospora chalcea]MBC8994413.1 dihydropteroate synthase [Micromonospora chalcea]